MEVSEQRRSQSMTFMNLLQGYNMVEGRTHGWVTGPQPQFQSQSWLSGQIM